MDATIAEATQSDPPRELAKLRRQLAERDAQLAAKSAALDEALAQQQASVEVLQVIAASPGDLAPVFDAMLDKAMRLCEAPFGGLLIPDGGSVRYVALRNAPRAWADFLAHDPLRLRTLLSPAFLDAPASFQIADLAETDGYLRRIPLVVAGVELGGIRAVLFVPLLKNGALIGVFTIYRQEVQPFSDKQVTLVENFAAQAVIAMENARLLNETREALEQQTATGEVLKAISRSTFDLDAVLQTAVASAVRLCRGQQGVVFRNDGTEYRFAAGYGNRPEYDDSERAAIIRPGRGTIVGRAALEGRAVQILDALTDPDYEDKESARLNNSHTMLGVPLLRDGEVIGAFGLARNRVEPFSEGEVALVTTFADQAVIAIENARLLTETREALGQQQAMAEVLGVINANPGNLQPVFDAMLEKALNICDAALGGLLVFEAAQFRNAALHGAPPAFAEFLRQPFSPTGPLAAIVEGEAVVQISDVVADPDYAAGIPARRALADLGGARTAVWLALRKDSILLGVIWFYRQEVRPFSDKQIALLQSFAAQAVIAMDNARLLDEIRQRQAELRVTFDNMGDGVAMFDPDLRLAAWNRNFQTLLDLPDEFVTRRPSLTEYVDYMAARGEYDTAEREADIRSGLTDAARQNRFERTRPDGRVIEVRRDPVPGGGFVLMFADVTERKRAEAEIRGARDAAEKALGELNATQQQLVLQQKMAALGQLTAGIAHEIKNPLNFVNNFAGLSNELLEELKEAAAPAFAALDDGARADIDDTIDMLSGNLAKIAEHGRRADNIVKSMLEHSRGGSGERRTVDLNALIEEALNLAYHGARAQDQNFNITLERDLAAAMAPVELAPQEMTRVFLNLFGNGFYAANKRKATAGNGFRPVLRVATRDLGDVVEARVRDNGTGIAPEIRDKLFQPFVTTKPTGEGTGLGLSISYEIVTQQHGGTIEVASEPGAFTEFTIRLPRTPTA